MQRAFPFLTCGLLLRPLAAFSVLAYASAVPRLARNSFAPARSSDSYLLRNKL
jgi:hypothetical protein